MPSNRQFAKQGAVSSSSRISRLKQLTKTNYGQQFSSKNYFDPHKEFKKKRYQNAQNKCDIQYKKNSHTKCFKTPLPLPGWINNDGHTRFKRGTQSIKKHKISEIEYTEIGDNSCFKKVAQILEETIALSRVRKRKLNTCNPCVVKVIC